MTFSGVNSSLNAFSAKNLRLSTNWRMRATASSFLMWKGSTASGTAPFGTCSLTPNTWRHQWQRAVISLSVLIVTSAPQPLHLNVRSTASSAAMSRAPEAMIVPSSWSMSFAEAELLLDALAVPLVAAERADEQVGAGLLADVRRAALRTVVEAVLQLVRPTCRWRPDPASAVRRGSVAAALYGSTPSSPGGGGTSCGDPGPVNFGGGGGVGSTCRRAPRGPAPWPSARRSRPA